MNIKLNLTICLLLYFENKSTKVATEKHIRKFWKLLKYTEKSIIELSFNELEDFRSTISP